LISLSKSTLLFFVAGVFPYQQNWFCNVKAAYTLPRPTIDDEKNYYNVAEK